jgi:branched-chain amino acid transport system permease protein
MTSFFYTSQVLLDLVLLNCGLALSQYVVQKAGVFSIATAGFASAGAYAAAIVVLRADVPMPVAIALASFVGLLLATLLSFPLARLRGAYQAIATMAFVQITMAVMYYAEDWTGGAVGLKGIPKLVDTWELVIFVAITVYIIHSLSLSAFGRAFDAIRDDEVVAATLGISVPRNHIVAFAISGVIAGAFGGLHALYFYAIEPSMFGFSLAIAVMTFVIFGGQQSILGPLVGATVLTILPEVARPLADSRMFVFGFLLVLSTIFLPDGFVDGIATAIRRARKARTVKASTVASSVKRTETT